MNVSQQSTKRQQDFRQVSLVANSWPVYKQAKNPLRVTLAIVCGYCTALKVGHNSLD